MSNTLTCALQGSVPCSAARRCRECKLPASANDGLGAVKQALGNIVDRLSWKRRQRPLASLPEREVLALVIAGQENISRTLVDYSDALREHYPHTASVFDGMVGEQTAHRRMLLHAYVERFGNHLPPVRYDDIKGVPVFRGTWKGLPTDVGAMRRHADRLQGDASRFYTEAAALVSDARIRGMLGDLATAEKTPLHGASEENPSTHDGDVEESHAQQRFVLQIVQPGLVGLIDGSVSTLAPVFAAAFATHMPWNAFLVGMAASVGAGISMGMAEALSDDGKLSGRGNPLLRGLICGAMTTLGGVGHTLPYLIADFWTATVTAFVVVGIELAAIAWMQWKWMDTPLLSSIAKVSLGGSLVMAVGVLIGSG